MANIDTYIEQIRVAEYGEEVRGSIINALVAENNESNAAYNAAIASQSSAQNSAAAAATSAGNAAESARVASEVGTNSVNAINGAAYNATTAIDAAVSTATATLAGYDDRARTSAEAAEGSANRAEGSAVRAKASEEAAANSANAAAGSANAASTSAATARDAEANAKTSEVEAGKSKEAAAKSAESAKSNADSAITSINTVLNIQTAVDKSAKDAADSAKAAEDAAKAAIGIAKIDFAKSDTAGLAKPDNKTIKVIDAYGTLSAPGIEEHIDDDVMYDRSDNPDGVHNIRIYNSQTGKRTLQHYDGTEWTDQFTDIKMPDDGTITMDDDGTIHGNTGAITSKNFGDFSNLSLLEAFRTIFNMLWNTPNFQTREVGTFTWNGHWEFSAIVYGDGNYGTITATKFSGEVFQYRKDIGLGLDDFRQLVDNHGNIINTLYVTSKNFGDFTNRPIIEAFRTIFNMLWNTPNFQTREVGTFTWNGHWEFSAIVYGDGNYGTITATKFSGEVFQYRKDIGLGLDDFRQLVDWHYGNIFPTERKVTMDDQDEYNHIEYNDSYIIGTIVNFQIMYYHNSDIPTNEWWTIVKNISNPPKWVQSGMAITDQGHILSFEIFPDGYIRAKSFLGMQVKGGERLRLHCCYLTKY